MKIYFILIFQLLLSHFIYGQESYSSSIPKAVHNYEVALKFYDAHVNDKALDAIESALKEDPKFIEAHMLKANIFTDTKQFDKAIQSYLDAININPDFFPNNYFSLGRVEYMSGKYSDAKMHLQKFITYQKIRPEYRSAAKQIIMNASFADSAVKNPVPFDPVNMGDSINSEYDEYFPSITADGKTFLITRDIPGTVTKDQEDFFISKMGSKGWSKATPMSEINTEGNEGAPSLSPDGMYLFFTACEDMGISTTARKTNGSCDIFIAKKKGDKFMNPRNLEAPINTGSWETQPSFSSDGRTLYFVRKIKDKYNNLQSDIYVTHINDNSEWSEPVSVSDKINTPYNESCVFIHPDDQTLYFSSDGHPGMGGEDIFISRKDSAGNWGEPVNLGYPINTIKDEISLLVSPDGEMAYFSSNRQGGKGGLDIYQFPLYQKARPNVVTYMKGKVFDAETKQFLSANFELIDLKTGKTVVSSSSNIGNGEFLVALPTGKRYALNVSKDGYLFYSENFELLKQDSTNKPYLKDVPMKPIKAGESIVLKNIFYETDKFDLKDESKIELNKLITFLNKNPKIKFEVSGHTDNVGTKPYNQALSEKRALSVFNFLKSNGIPESRMTSVGYGDTKPVADNKSETGRAQNRRTEFKVISN